MELSLPETLRRLRTHAEEPGPDSRELAARTALPEDTVRALPRGPGVPPGTVEERVCARVRTPAAAQVARRRTRPGDPVTEIAGRLGTSQLWARKPPRGEKTPDVTLPHGLAAFLGVAEGEAFFTAPPADALDRVPRARPARRGHPAPGPIRVLTDGHAVADAGPRRDGAVAPERPAQPHAGLIRSVLPTREGTQQR